ncbi:hypothetical protein PILCRDRAFT_823325 [Piloderma croceum F 1598]|uniref:Uncharacterized protein n=1 Tax=Piloderma croceum (strain F 1598) TaxID=765440 RepID=A0A0C3FJU2_PILCF|nr:hypothetical protein PILCRDRAFT_823325 [Piloderma croceum F 1598]
MQPNHPVRKEARWKIREQTMQYREVLTLATPKVLQEEVRKFLIRPRHYSPHNRIAIILSGAKM